jgi:hypothetical protein
LKIRVFITDSVGRTAIIKHSFHDNSATKGEWRCVCSGKT